MYISRLYLTHFLCHRNLELNLSQGINFFVGNNNSGKTSILRAVSFLRSGLGRGQNASDIIFRSNEPCSNAECCVMAIITFSPGEVTVNDDENLGLTNKTILNDHAFDKLGNYLFKKNSSNVKEPIYELKIKRTASDSKKILICKPESENEQAESKEEQTWENPTGIPALVQRLLDPVFVWAEDTPETVADFSPNKALGKLIGQQLERLKQGNLWQEFQLAHKNLFDKNDDEHPEEQNFADLVEDTLTALKNKLDEQYGGNNSVRFQFDPPSVESFTKQGTVILREENGIETGLEEKGTGMQRAFALAVIELLADQTTGTGKNELFCLDEPTTYLHPRAQIKLAAALEHLSTERNQLLITTHSPYMIRGISKYRDTLFMLRAHDEFTKVIMPEKRDDRPRSLSEITYFAFDIPTIEYHIELFGDIYEILNRREAAKRPKDATPKDMTIKACGDKMEEIVTQKLSLPTEYIGRYDDRITQKRRVTEFLPLGIRNMIDHPHRDDDPHKDNKFTDDQLKSSIEIMINILVYLQQNPDTN